MDSQVERTLLQLPQRTLRALTFCETDVNSVHQWLSELPKADKVRSAKKLVQALDELTRLNVAPSLHWSLIEQCRPVVYYLVQQIQKQLLNNLVTFSDEQQEDYSVCLQLLLRLLTAYKVIVQSSSDTTAPGSPLAAALHRALADSASTLLVTYEFYRPAPARLWLEMHALYHLAAKSQLLDFVMEDSLTLRTRQLSLSDIYKRALLLSRSRFNQLRPSEIRQVNKALCLWAPHSNIEPVEKSRSHFVVNQDSDEGLLYTALSPGDSNSHLLALDSRLLAAHLKKLSETLTEEKPGTLSKRVVDHLASAWSLPGKRKHKRQKSNGQCDICIGFSAVHYHLFDEQTFDTLVSGHTDVNRSGHSQFSSGDSSDAWAEAHDTRPADGEKKTGNVSPISFSKSEVKRSLYPTTSSSVINTCAGGYCLSLDITMKQQLRTGELVAVREKGQKNWLLAAVRWVQAKNKHQLLLGLELLSAATKPCAVTPLKKTMDTSHYQRAFLLPVIPHVNDMPTLITPKVPFKNGLKFILLQGSKIRRGQLLECVSSSPGYSQYQFRLLEDQF